MRNSLGFAKLNYNFFAEKTIANLCLENKKSKKNAIFWIIYLIFLRGFIKSVLETYGLFYCLFNNYVNCGMLNNVDRQTFLVTRSVHV